VSVTVVVVVVVVVVDECRGVRREVQVAERRPTPKVYQHILLVLLPAFLYNADANKGVRPAP